jgi:chromosome segregation ATPase
LDEKERIEQQKKGLEGTLEERARQAQQLQLDNDKLCEEIESLKSQLKNEQEARAELQEKDTYLEEKVEVLKQLCEQESEEKTELEKAKQLVEKQLEELKGQYNVLIDSHGGRGKLVQSLQSQLEEEKKRTTELSLNVATLEESVASLKGDIKEISEKLEKERQLRQQETEANERRNKAELDGIGVLKVNLSNHIEDLRLWQKLLELPGVGDLDFQSEIRPQIVSSLNGEDFNKQVQILSKKLEEEDGELMKLWKMKEAEIKSKKAKNASKKQHNK